MKRTARIATIGCLGLAIWISACSCGKDFSKNFTTPNDAPVGYYDVVKYENGIFTGIGWSADKEDGAPIKMVLVYVDGKAVGEAKFIHYRLDVVGVFEKGQWVKSGWEISAKIPLTRGAHSSMALSYDSRDALNVAMKEFIVE
jgi:hypothetical protein